MMRFILPLTLLVSLNSVTLAGESATLAAESAKLATTPVDRNNSGWWRTRHEAKVKEAEKGGYDLVFIGDSITQGWEGSGKKVWKKYYAHRSALNLGYSADRTEHVLWRLQNGELENVDPKLFVVMIGTNNTGQRQDAPEDTAEGVRLILDLLRKRNPAAKVLLLAVFPCDEQADGWRRKTNDEVNKLIKPMAAGMGVGWLDLSEVFLDENGVLPKSVMPDRLHPKRKGYGMWAAAMEPTIKELLK